MCRLRCFIYDYGREKVLDLVNYRKERELSVIRETGTDGIPRSRKKFRDMRKSPKDGGLL